MKSPVIWVAATLIAVAIFLRARPDDSTSSTVVVQHDTVIIRDTVRVPVPEPVARIVVRHDTVWLPTVPDLAARPDTMAADTAAVVMPITAITYATDDYTAVVEGYRPRLISIELYPRTSYITTTATHRVRPRWAVTIGPGVGISAKSVTPYMGITAGLILWQK